jgi:hypothetical protein
VRERDHSEELAVDGRIISKLILGKCEWGVDWIQVTQWLALLKTVININVP